MEENSHRRGGRMGEGNCEGVTEISGAAKDFKHCADPNCWSHNNTVLYVQGLGQLCLEGEEEELFH